MFLLEGGNQRGAQIMHRHCSSGISLHVLLPYSVNVIEGFIEVNKSNMSWGLEDSVTCHFICVLGLKLNAYLLRLRHLKRVAEEVAIYKAAEPFYH